MRRADADRGEPCYDCVVVGGGPAGATAAAELVRRGYSVLLLDRDGRVKPCGGAIPPQLLREFEIPEALLVARVDSARMVAPSARFVDMPIDGGYVGMVDREVFDEWLRERAAAAGAERRNGRFVRLSRDRSGRARVHYRPARGSRQDGGCGQSAELTVCARTVIGADGARSAVAREGLPGVRPAPFVAAYHEIIRAPQTPAESKVSDRAVDDAVGNANAAGDYHGRRCDVYYQGRLSPDFYGWVFPHGDTVSVGVGSAHKGFALRQAVALLRRSAGLDGAQTIRCEGAPIPLKPLSRWDNGRDLILAGDAAGVVAPASGEGIYYAMSSGRLAAEAVATLLQSGDVKALARARKRFLDSHGKVFWMLGMMQYFWYSSDRRRERFVSICADRDVQRLTWEAYMNKRLVRARPLAHLRIFCKDLAHLFRLVAP